MTQHLPARPAIEPLAEVFRAQPYADQLLSAVLMGENLQRAALEAMAGLVAVDEDAREQWKRFNRVRREVGRPEMELVL